MDIGTQMVQYERELSKLRRDLQAGLSRERIEAVLSDYYGALTQTSIDYIADALSERA